MKRISADGVYSLGEFQQNADRLINNVKQTRKPILLTVDGAAEVVIVDAVEYEEMLNSSEKGAFASAVQEGLKEADAEKSRPIEGLYGEIEERFGLTLNPPTSPDHS